MTGAIDPDFLEPFVSRFTVAVDARPGLHGDGVRGFQRRRRGRTSPTCDILQANMGTTGLQIDSMRFGDANRDRDVDANDLQLWQPPRACRSRDASRWRRRSPALLRDESPSHERRLGSAIGRSITASRECEPALHDAGRRGTYAAPVRPPAEVAVAVVDVREALLLDVPQQLDAAVGQRRGVGDVDVATRPRRGGSVRGRGRGRRSGRGRRGPSASPRPARRRFLRRTRSPRPNCRSARRAGRTRRARRRPSSGGR